MKLITLDKSIQFNSIQFNQNINPHLKNLLYNAMINICSFTLNVFLRFSVNS